MSDGCSDGMSDGCSDGPFPLYPSSSSSLWVGGWTGIRTLEEAREYEALKRSREKDLKAKRQYHREPAPYLFTTALPTAPDYDNFSEDTTLAATAATANPNTQLLSSSNEQQVGSHSSSTGARLSSSSSSRRRRGGLGLGLDNSCESDSAAAAVGHHGIVPAATGRGRKAVKVETTTTAAAAVQNPSHPPGSSSSGPSGRQQRRLLPPEDKDKASSSSSSDDQQQLSGQQQLVDLSHAPGRP